MHPTIRPYLEYFAVPAGYGPPGLCWSLDGEAMEFADGTWRFGRQIADFIDGFASVRAIPHFGHVIECLALLSVPAPCTYPERFRSLALMFRRLNSPARNAGALFAHLSVGIPSAAHVPPGGGKSLAHWLTHSPSLGFLHQSSTENPEVPTLAAQSLHARVAARLEGMSDYELRHWLRHGVGPDDAPAQALADQLNRRPPTMAEFLDAAIKDRSRLGDAVPLVRHFVSALSLPPRKRTPPKLPIGGYADVTNRGDPSRLLPSQLALDPDDFVRRFAENELLFFRREDPHERRQEHLALVVDQGVLTWGPVRLALGAAVLAFGRLSTRRKLAVSVRFGSSPAERFTLPDRNPEHFGEVLEASDLSPHPIHALAEEMLDSSAPERDIILLTHPRSLGETEIRRLAKLLTKGCRLFALTVTEAGTVELFHVREGGPVPVSRFKIDFHRPSPVPAASTSAFYLPWSGDVEAIPFPFRFGLTNRVGDLDFDTGGQTLLVATVSGFLHAWNLADGSVEVLPRGFKDGQILKSAQAVIGVGNGFAVCGRFGTGLAVVHYDLATRTATLHKLMADSGELQTVWYGFPKLNAVVVKVGPVYRAVDLGTGGLFPDPRHVTELTARARLAVDKARDLLLPPPQMPVSTSENNPSPTPPYLVHSSATGHISFQRHDGNVFFMPMSDGRPRFRTFAPIAQYAGNVLALLATQWSLHDLDNEGNTIVEYPPLRFAGANNFSAKLSNDGRLFVRQTATSELTVTEPAGRGTLLITQPGRCHSNLEVRLGYRCLGLSVGARGCLIEWGAGPMKVLDGPTAATNFGQRARNKLVPWTGTLATSADRFIGLHRLSHCDVGVDGFGQVAFACERRVRCMFFFRRGKLAAWSPDGARYGPPELTGGPETPGSLEGLGEILRKIAG